MFTAFVMLRKISSQKPTSDPSSEKQTGRRAGEVARLPVWLQESTEVRSQLAYHGESTYRPRGQDCKPLRADCVGRVQDTAGKFD